MPSQSFTQICATTLVTILAVVAAIPVSAQRGDLAIQLTNSADIAAASSVNNALNSLVEQAGSCKTPGMACACSLKLGLSRLSAAYHSAIEGRPSWKQAAVQYLVKSNGRLITTAIFFPTIRRQLDMCHVP